MNTETRTDLIGALMVHGEQSVETDKESRVRVASRITSQNFFGKLGYKNRKFSVSKRADRMDVVEALGVKHNINIICTDHLGSRVWTWEYESEDKQFGAGVFRSHEEAARAALESLADIYLKEGEG